MKKKAYYIFVGVVAVIIMAPLMYNITRNRLETQIENAETRGDMIEAMRLEDTYDRTYKQEDAVIYVSSSIAWIFVLYFAWKHEDKK